MSLAENKTLVRRYFEEARHAPEICDEIFAPRFQFHTIQHASVTSQTVESNPQSEKTTYAWLAKVWSPDWHMAVDEMIAEGERVMVRWTFRGKQVGEYAGLPPTNKDVIYSGINIFRIENGKIAEVWDISDRLWLWQQLGVLPEIKEAVAAVQARVKDRE
jgi:predicted ester cyclase